MKVAADGGDRRTRSIGWIMDKAKRCAVMGSTRQINTTSGRRERLSLVVIAGDQSKIDVRMTRAPLYQQFKDFRGLRSRRMEQVPAEKNLFWARALDGQA